MADPPNTANSGWSPNIRGLMRGFADPSLRSIPSNASKLLKRCSRSKAVAILSGLLFHPQFQSSCVRLEALVHLSLAKSAGRKSPNFNVLSASFNLLGDTPLGRFEDPAEDIMVANVIYGGTNYRILTGIWESAGFLLQRMLDVVDSMPQGRGFDQLRSSIRAILVLSDQVCQKAGLERNQMGNEIPLQRFPQIDSRQLNRLRGLTLFSPAELKKLAVTQDELRPLIFESDQYESLLQSELGQSPLERRPLIQVGSDVRLALPTAVTVAVRRLIIDGIHGTANQPAFELALSKSYAKLFSRTPVLGAGMMPPLSFSKIGPVYAAAAQLTADIKTTLQLIFLVDGLDDYKASDWREVGVVGDEVTNFIVSRVEEVSKEDTTGATLIVHCGWGRRVALGFPKDNPNQWDIRAITAADLATLSWCSEVDPLTILKLIDAQKALESERVDLGEHEWGAQPLRMGKVQRLPSCSTRQPSKRLEYP